MYHKKLRTIKLRGSISQGIVAKLDINPSYPTMYEGGVTEGIDFTQDLGITKWEEPIPVQMRGKVRQTDPNFIRYTDIENYKNYPNSYSEGIMVVATEKIHGTNFRVANIDGVIHVGSHRMDLCEEENNLYWRAAEILKAKEKLLPGEQVFAEVYGSGVQDLNYGLKSGQINVAIFDIWKDSKFLDYTDYIQYLLAKGWQDLATPVVYMGEWNLDLPKMSDGQSILCPDQIREGIVIRPMQEAWSPYLNGRLIIKCVSDTYLLRKEGTERH